MPTCRAVTDAIRQGRGPTIVQMVNEANGASSDAFLTVGGWLVELAGQGRAWCGMALQQHGVAWHGMIMFSMAAAQHDMAWHGTVHAQHALP